MKLTSNKKDIVLIVDDSPETLGMLNDTLDDAGITVLVALEGRQALTISQSITPDIILMDAIMPNMDGFETCKILKENKDLNHIPVIFMTGLSDTESIVKGFEAGGVDYITKPVNSDELIARLKVHLSNARQTINARLALDSAGKFLFSANESGDILWATPQAHQLLESLLSTDKLQTNELANSLKKLISPHFNKEKAIELINADRKFEIRYVSQTNKDEFLLQVVENKNLSDIDILKNVMPTTDRETEVLLWIARGKTNREIGAILEMSPRTVNKHLEQIFKKLNVENRTSAAVIALKHIQKD